jgi:hypothetical protein
MLEEFLPVAESDMTAGPVAGSRTGRCIGTAHSRTQASLSPTRCYTDVDAAALLAVYDKAHPRAHWR